jgi:hypothetical protein
MGWECETCEEKRNVYSVMLGHQKKKDHLGDLSIDWKVV